VVSSGRRMHELQEWAYGLMPILKSLGIIEDRKRTKDLNIDDLELGEWFHTLIHAFVYCNVMMCLKKTCTHDSPARNPYQPFTHKTIVCFDVDCTVG